MSIGTNLLDQYGCYLDVFGSQLITGDLNLGANSTLVVEGSVMVNGNFNFAGTIEFVGNGSSFQVNGNVNNNGGTATGTWTGTQL